MTLRAKPSAPRRRRAGDSEERFQFWVTIGFIGLIVIVVLFLVGDVALSYYNDHFKPIATVGGVAVTPDQLKDRIKLETFRLNSEEGQIRTQLAANKIDANTANTQISAIETALQSVSTQAAQDLVDLLYKSQLAAADSLSVSDADVQAKMTQDASTPEQRHVLAIFVAPAADASSGAATPAGAQKALADATAAAAALTAGTPFDQVAKQYSTDTSKDTGGDYGFITASNTTDATWVQAVFALPLNGTTPAIKGADGTYRIGRVSEIDPGTVDAAYQTDVLKEVGSGSYHDNIAKEALADKLKAKVITDATSGSVDQVKLAEIVINTPSGATDQPQIHASHILYSPNNDASNAASLPPDDPAWTAAQQKAQATADLLKAITDVTQREQKFADIAKTDSTDTTSGANGGDLGFFTPGTMVTEFNDALFNNANLQPGDIVGPVKTQFGYHVILFQERLPAAADRLKTVQAALAASGADFNAIAKADSDGPEAPQGGELGWKTKDQLDPAVATAVFALQAGQTTSSIQLTDSYRIEKVEDRQTRPLDPDQVTLVAATAFDTWYSAKQSAAVSAGTISEDQTYFPTSSSGQ